MQAERLEAEIREAPPGPGLQQLSVDGAMVLLLHGEWAEVKTLAIGTIDEPNLRGEVHARDLSYFSRMMEHRGFARLATVETHRRGTERAGEVCAVVNSPHWRATEKGGQRINRNECLIVISKRHSFGYWIKRDDAEWSQWAFKTEDEAKRAVFYKLQDIIEED